MFSLTRDRPRLSALICLPPHSKASLREAGRFGRSTRASNHAHTALSNCRVQAMPRPPQPVISAPLFFIFHSEKELASSYSDRKMFKISQLGRQISNQRFSVVHPGEYERRCLELPWPWLLALQAQRRKAVSETFAGIPTTNELRITNCPGGGNCQELQQGLAKGSCLIAMSLPETWSRGLLLAPVTDFTVELRVQVRKLISCNLQIALMTRKTVRELGNSALIFKKCRFWVLFLAI
jgi:hypothetical protein